MKADRRASQRKEQHQPSRMGSSYPQNQLPPTFPAGQLRISSPMPVACKLQNHIWHFLLPLFDSPITVVCSRLVLNRFADIVGFTAWSSMREPSQVFALLEHIYSSFDAIAKRRHVFKVETIGDCYGKLGRVIAFVVP